MSGSATLLPSLGSGPRSVRSSVSNDWAFIPAAACGLCPGETPGARVNFNEEDEAALLAPLVAFGVALAFEVFSLTASSRGMATAAMHRAASRIHARLRSWIIAMNQGGLVGPGVVPDVSDVKGCWIISGLPKVGQFPVQLVPTHSPRRQVCRVRRVRFSQVSVWIRRGVSPSRWIRRDR